MHLFHLSVDRERTMLCRGTVVDTAGLARHQCWPHTAARPSVHACGSATEGSRLAEDGLADPPEDWLAGDASQNRTFWIVINNAAEFCVTRFQTSTQ